MKPHSSPRGILGGPVDGPARLAASYPAVPAVPDTLVLHRASGFAGRIVHFEATAQHTTVALKGSTGLTKTFPVHPGDFAVDGRTVHLVEPRKEPTETPELQGGKLRMGERTASGSRRVDGAPARVARESRIVVEGKHDAELLERVWGDDLRLEAIVVEILDGADHLGEFIAGFGPGPGRRLGVLLDHVVTDSKEARIAASVRDPDVLVLGTPFIDVWQAIRPEAAGIESWPTIPMGTPWKDGICAALGVDDPPRYWSQLLARVGTWADLDQSLVAAVEQLIDFVTSTDTTQ